MILGLLYKTKNKREPAMQHLSEADKSSLNSVRRPCSLVSNLLSQS